MKELVELLSAKQSFIVTSHLAPDPDAIGSSAGLALTLHRLGKHVSLYYVDPIPRSMRRLVEQLPKQIVIHHQVPTTHFDAVVVTDTASRPRVGVDGEKLFACGDTVVNIDHHISNDSWADFNHIDHCAAATAQIIAALVECLGARSGKSLWDGLLADLLYAGLMDDTGSFRFNNTDDRAHSIAADLVQQGAKPSEVSRDLYYTVPLKILQLRAHALREMQLLEGGKFTLITVTLAALKQFGCTAEDTEGLIDEGRLVEGTRASVLIREMDEKTWKVSLRSKYDDLDVGGVAARFGGGGHRAAAGCRISGSREHVVAEITKALCEAFPKLD